MSFAIALSGINAINSELNTISNNIANAGTYGFKSSRTNFAAMVAGTQPTGAEAASMTQSIETGGGVVNTGRAMDAAIQGRGFFVTRDSSGEMLYTRVGIFNADKDGYVVDSFNRRVQGYAATEAGAAAGAMGDLRVPMGQVAAKPSDELKYVGNLSAGWTTPTVATFDRTDPLSFNSSMVSVVHDSLGVQHSVTQYFVKSATNQVTVHYTFDGAGLAQTTTLDFGSDGQLTAPLGPLALALGTPAGANALSVALDYTGTTQFAGESTTTVNSSNGHASGTLIGLQLDDTGSVVAQYSNGEKQSVGTLALATFANENALVPVSETSWSTSVGSGTPLFFTPGSGMAGTLSVGALEQSNVDMTGQLVSLMSAQRNYQANTKVISTQNEMMQSLMQAV
ncbi:flagellar hook-basal body complex protein [Aquabacterium sp. A7-Y]|uniref:flagellar hook protein FlgE n=1 Tax=Aquabacterium sp. A7-Y TaxID=1349605 RepID=UPI00223DCFD9|nr:flagellar hook-basal body complex protein [Aquabacterium sp. A7-Y]MCW7536538.1 flagellar hook-basal body complex protein [Aquabacterium sp. A7-Y]